MSDIRTTYQCKPFMCQFVCKLCEVMTWETTPPQLCPYGRRAEWEEIEQKTLIEIREENDESEA